MRALGRRKYPRMVTDEDAHLLNNIHTYAILTTHDPASTCRLQFIVRWPVDIEEHKDLPLEIRKFAYSVLLWCGIKRITRLDPYRGPLSDIIFALATVDIGVGFSLEKGGYTNVIDFPPWKM